MKTILLDSSLPQDWLLGGRRFVQRLLIVNSSAGCFALDFNSFRMFFAARLSLLSCYNSFEFFPYPGNGNYPFSCILQERWIHA